LVLLKNANATLPISPKLNALAVVGPLANDGKNQLGCWAYDGKEEDSVTPLSALRESAAGHFELHYAPGLPHARSDDTSGFGEAVEAAKAAELVIAFVGEDANISGECRSRAFLTLPGAQQQLLEAVAETGTPLVVVIMAGRPLVLESTLKLASALLYAWHPGTMGGPALRDVLFGHSPCGKLPVSFPRSVGQIPVYYSHKSTGRPPKEPARGVPSGTPLDPVDFDASYIDLEVTPEFPFGFGLSYTSFEYSSLKVTPEAGKVGQSVSVSAELKNTGEVLGTEVVQLYLHDKFASVTRPVRELRGFQRVSLKPGEATRISFELSAEALSFIGQDMQAVTEPGVFEVFVGGDSNASLSASFRLD
jgi:beta-glucosidase